MRPDSGLELRASVGCRAARLMQCRDKESVGGGHHDGQHDSASALDVSVGTLWNRRRRRRVDAPRGCRVLGVPSASARAPADEAWRVRALPGLATGSDYSTRLRITDPVRHRAPRRLGVALSQKVRRTGPRTCSPEPPDDRKGSRHRDACQRPAHDRYVAMLIQPNVLEPDGVNAQMTINALSASRPSTSRGSLRW